MLKIPKHITFRIGIAVASIALTGSLILGVAVNAAFMNSYAPLSNSERQAASLLSTSYCIPVVVGLLVMLPQNFKWVRWIGSLIIFGVAPVSLVALLISGFIAVPSEELFWMLCYLAFAVGYWLYLRPVRGSDISEPIDLRGEQGGDGDAEEAVCERRMEFL